jgi:kinesin family protein 5
MSENIKTYVRFRREVADSEKLYLIDGVNIKHKNTVFTFDNVFDSNTTQQRLFDTIGVGLIKNAINGYDSTIFAYGVSGSGKSYSQFGVLNSEQEIGLIPRCIKQLLSDLKEKSSKPELLNYYIKISFIEIYQENIRDLLSGSDDFLKIREAKSKGVYLQNLSEKQIDTYEGAIKCISKAVKQRVVASTDLNAVSSRSHAVLTILIEQEMENETILSKLHLVDLCGSEDVRKSGVTGVNLAEASKINSSLSALGNVIISLTDKHRTHIPYRDSKLTFLLQNSLGGNNKTTLLSTASMYSEDTLQTLQFTKRAKLIKNNPTLNKQESIKTLKLRIEQLTAELESCHAQYKQLSIDDVEYLLKYDYEEIEKLYYKQRSLSIELADKLLVEKINNMKTIQRYEDALRKMKYTL